MIFLSSKIQQVLVALKYQHQQYRKYHLHALSQCLHRTKQMMLRQRDISFMFPINEI